MLEFRLLFDEFLLVSQYAVIFSDGYFLATVMSCLISREASFYTGRTSLLSNHNIISVKYEWATLIDHCSLLDCQLSASVKCCPLNSISSSRHAR